MTLTDFLLARIAEDEEVARDAGGRSWEAWNIDSGDADHIARHDPARVLAECEAKRSVVHLLGMGNTLTSGREGYSVTVDAIGLLRLLALPYADHPDYREEWKP